MFLRRNIILIETATKKPKALLVFVDVNMRSVFGGSVIFADSGKSKPALQNLRHIEETELMRLTETALMTPVHCVRFKIAKPHPVTLVGGGQLAKIAEQVQEAGAEVIIFNTDINPRVKRRLEGFLHCLVIDRNEIIIQIFADKARTREAVLQARLAQLEYCMPYLTHKKTGLSQQRGGVKGSRGAGEKNLELDKRTVRLEIVKLKKEIEKVRVQRGVQRKSRMKCGRKIGAIVGYTNSGKSSLLKKLSGTDIYAEDKLFATLDAETKRVKLKDNTHLLLTDTVGFLNNLPHQLIDAFRATLEEIVLADFLLIICDASHPAVAECLSVTEKILAELHCAEKEKIVIINKMDAVFDINGIHTIMEKYPAALPVSVKTGEGIMLLKNALSLITKTV